MVKEEYYEKESIIVKLMVGIHKLCLYLLITGLYRKNCKFIFYVNFHFCRAGIRPALDFIIIDKKILNIYAR